MHILQFTICNVQGSVSFYLLRILLREAYESGKELVLEKEKKQKTKSKYDEISQVQL